MRTSTRLRQLLEQGLVFAPGVYNAMFAKLVEHVGFDAVYVTGFGTAARYGYADVGLVTQTEMVDNLRYICRATGLPVIADMDTGYGNVINLRRTVREYERAGVAGFHMEDQVFPKKCGFMEGKQVIPIEEAVQKVRAALDARADPDTVMIARTDALAPNGWDDAIRRARAYREAGADLVFMDGIRTRDELETYSRELATKGVPCLYNGVLVSAAEAQALGFKIQILAGAALAAVWASANAAMEELMSAGTVEQAMARYGVPPEGETLTDLLGVPEVYELERRYGRYETPPIAAR
ncbi:MAG: isocitrate lyase/PEP mutase family protein [Candidatus Rokubacteria bacterium]|nr:isocitrate lyase/PEP mutase family protein [Candidatus Rokubacteria bacterium]